MIAVTPDGQGDLWVGGPVARLGSAHDPRRLHDPVSLALGRPHRLLASAGTAFVEFKQVGDAYR